MGIRQFGHVKFDGVDLADFGVTLSGTGTYNAPERDVTSISVPGRNGDILIDNGRYFNIEVGYPVNIELGLPDKVPALRAFLMSHKGYFRLEDSYHPDEFRLAQYAGPFEINPTGSHNRYGRMVLTFNCKPQRFLKAGESPRLTLNTTAAATSPIICGIPDSIFNDDTISKIKALGYPTNVEFMFIDTSAHGDNDYLKVFYSDSFDIFAANGSLPCVSLSGSPLYGESAGALTYQGEWLDANRSFTIRCSSYYTNIVFPMPINCLIYRNVETNVREKIFPDSATLSAQSVMECAPLIHMTVSSAVNTPVAVLLNESLIGLNTPATVGDPNDPKTVTNVWVDCDTYDSYTIADGTKYSLNPYVTMTGKFTFDGPITVYSNSSIDQVEIIPRWWRL